jgi:hypothetical protein
MTSQPMRVLCPAVVAAIDAGHLRPDGNRVIEIEHDANCPGATGYQPCTCDAVIRTISATEVLTLDNTGRITAREMIQ